jgi:hypothetical protein
MNNKKTPIKEKYEGRFWCRERKKYYPWSEYIEHYKKKGDKEKRSESEKLMDDLEPIKDWEDEGGYVYPKEIFKDKK